jgi:hypothetical protein
VGAREMVLGSKAVVRVVGSGIIVEGSMGEEVGEGNEVEAEAEEAVVESRFSTVGTAASVGVVAVAADDDSGGVGVGVGGVAASAGVVEAVASSGFVDEPEPSGQGILGILGILGNEGQERFLRVPGR